MIEKLQDYVKKSHNMTENEQKSEKNLTEQWKNGELEFGEYWCKVVGSPYVEQVMSDCMTDEDIVEILGKIPSYKEYERILVENDSLKQICDELDCAVTQLREDKTDLIEENVKLKELLNYIRDEIADMPAYAKQQGFGWISEAAYRIDEVLK